jgi:hypothetical protein
MLLRSCTADSGLQASRLPAPCLPTHEARKHDACSAHTRAVGGVRTCAALGTKAVAILCVPRLAGACKTSCIVAADGVFIAASILGAIVSLSALACIVASAAGSDAGFHSDMSAAKRKQRWSCWQSPNIEFWCLARQHCLPGSSQDLMSISRHVVHTHLLVHNLPSPTKPGLHSHL